jgi:hypothetical protein
VRKAVLYSFIIIVFSVLFTEEVESQTITEFQDDFVEEWAPKSFSGFSEVADYTPLPGQHIVYGEEYAEDFMAFAREMKKVDPTIKVGACGDFNDNFTYDCMQNPEFVEACDWMGVHDYYGVWNASHSEAELKSQADMVQETADRYRNIFQNAGYAKDVIPLALTEWNTASVGNYATLSMGGAILHAKAVGKEIEAGYGMINMFAMSDVWRNKGDLGLISNWSSSAPKENGFNEPTYPEGTPSPVFYPYAYFTKTFGDKLIQSNSSDLEVRAYSSVFSNSPHATTTVLINETNQSKIAEINTGGQPQNFYFYEISPVDQNYFSSTQIAIINMNQQTVLSGRFESKSKKLDVSNLEPGVFILKVDFDNQSVKRKIVME